jgi:iron complex transport system permease protein
MARHVTITFRLALLLACVAAVSLLVGDSFIGPANTLILTQVRLSRTLLAVLIGTLGLSGAVLQGALRNPLADPGLPGITRTASPASLGL